MTGPPGPGAGAGPRHPQRATAFEALVDDYDAARPGYPDALYDALPPFAGARLLELGAGTGKQTPGLLARGAAVVSTDRDPQMLARLHRHHPDLPVAIARAEQLPFAGGSFDGVCGTQKREAAHDQPLSEVFDTVDAWTGSWRRTLDWPTYDRWLRRKSYVAALPDEAGFLAAERASLQQVFPGGVIVEPFRIRLLTARLAA